MATPHVAGAVAQLRSLLPSFGPDALKAALLCLASPNKLSGLPPGTEASDLLLFTGKAALMTGGAYTTLRKLYFYFLLSYSSLM